MAKVDCLGHDDSTIGASRLRPIAPQDLEAARAFSRIPKKTATRRSWWQLHRAIQKWARDRPSLPRSWAKRRCIIYQLIASTKGDLRYEWAGIWQSSLQTRKCWPDTRWKRLKEQIGFEEVGNEIVYDAAFEDLQHHDQLPRSNERSIWGTDSQTQATDSREDERNEKIFERVGVLRKYQARRHSKEFGFLIGNRKIRRQIWQEISNFQQEWWRRPWWFDEDLESGIQDEPKDAGCLTIRVFRSGKFLPSISVEVCSEFSIRRIRKETEPVHERMPDWSESTSRWLSRIGDEAQWNESR